MTGTQRVRNVSSSSRRSDPPKCVSGVVPSTPRTGGNLRRRQWGEAPSFGHTTCVRDDSEQGYVVEGTVEGRPSLGPLDVVDPSGWSHGLAGPGVGRRVVEISHSSSSPLLQPLGVGRSVPRPRFDLPSVRRRLRRGGGPGVPPPTNGGRGKGTPTTTISDTPISLIQRSGIPRLRWTSGLPGSG